MASGFFQGGMAEGMSDAQKMALAQSGQTADIGLRTRALDIQQQQADRLHQNDIISQVDKHIADTMAIVGETIKQVKASGGTEQQALNVVQPLLANVAPLAAKGGRDPQVYVNQAKAMAASMGVEADKFQKTGTDAMGGEQYGFVSGKNKTITPGTVVGGEPKNDTTGLTGEAFLKAQPAEIQGLIKKIAEYDINPTTLSIKGAHRERLLSMVSQYDPTYDQTSFTARSAAKKEFNSGGPNSPAGQITAGNTAIQHLLSISDSAQKLGGASNYGPLNSILNKANIAIEGAKNNPDLARYNTAVDRFVEEATKFYRGVGGNEADIKRAIDTITAAQSPEARNAAIAEQASLMQSKVNALQDRWKTALGPAAWQRATGTGEFPIVQQKSQAALQTIKERAGELMPQASAGIDPRAIALLKSAPGTRAQFDAKYGAGAAAKILGE